MVMMMLFASVNVVVAQPYETRIGAEIGTNHIFGHNDFYFGMEHPVFRFNSYFFPLMAEVGIDWQFGIYRTDMHNPNGGADADRMREILEENDMKLLIVPSDFSDGGTTYDGLNFIRRHNLPFRNNFYPDNPSIPTYLWDSEFFPTADAKGNSMTNYPNGIDPDNFQFWETTENPFGGFIIGHPDSTGDDHTQNWALLGERYRAFCLGNHLHDNYKIRF